MSAMDVVCRPLDVADADQLFTLRAKALRNEPQAFASSPDDDLYRHRQAAAESLSRYPDQVVMGAFADARMVAMTGCARLDKLKTRHRVYLWGVYVEPEFRGRGLARRLLQLAIAHSRTLTGVVTADITVLTSSMGALRLYQELGFKLWGTQPNSLLIDGVFYDEHHLSMRLEPTKESR